MPLTRRRSSATALSKMKAAVVDEVVILDSDEEDEVAKPTTRETVTNHVDEEAIVKPVPKAPKRTASKTKRGVHVTAMSSVTLPVASDSKPAPDNIVNLRRAATVPISEVRSRTYTLPKTQTKIETEKVESKGDMIGDVSQSSIKVTHDDPPSVEIAPSQEEEKDETPLERKKTLALPARPLSEVKPKISVPERKPAVSSMSTPSRLSSTAHLKTETSGQSQKSSSGSNIFRSKNFIDADLIMATSTLEEIEELGSSVEAHSLHMKHSQEYPSQRSSYLMDEDSNEVADDDDDSDIDNIFSGPTKKKQCGPGRKPKNVKSESIGSSKSRFAHLQSSKSQSSSHKGMDDDDDLLIVGDVYPRNGYVPKVEEEGIVKSSPAKKPSIGSPTSSSTNGKAKKPRVPEANADSLLDELLGADRVRQASIAPAPGYSGLSSSGGGGAYYLGGGPGPLAQDSLAHLAQAQQYLEFSKMHDRRPTAPPSTALSNSGKVNKGPFTIKMKVGPNVLDLQVQPHQSIQNVLDTLKNAGQLRMLLPGESYFVKFDFVPLENKATISANNIAPGDELVLCVRGVDGNEDVGALEPVVEADNDGGQADLDKITLKVRMPDGKTHKFRLKKDEPLSKIAEAVCAKIGVPKVKLTFDSDPLQLDQSPEDCDLEDEDMLEAIVKK